MTQIAVIAALLLPIALAAVLVAVLTLEEAAPAPSHEHTRHPVW
jgi:hypothetical protein